MTLPRPELSYPLSVADEPKTLPIPRDALAADTVRALVEEFVTRDGTDYGRVERSLDEKITDVLRLLDSGDAVIVFDTETQTANIVLARDYPDAS